MNGALPGMPEMVRGQGRPPGAHLPWGIRMERSDAAAWENEEHRRSEYITFALVQQELLANKSLALQSAMQQQINLAWDLHASEHVACSCAPSPLQQVQHHEVEYIDIQHHYKLTVWQCTGCAACESPEDGYIRTLSADACLRPSSYAGAARATRHIKQHINTYLDPSGLEGDVQKLQDSNQLAFKGAFAAAAAQSSGASAGAADLADTAGASEATADVSRHAADCCAWLACARLHTSNVSAGQPCDIRGIVGFVYCHGIAVPQLFCNMRTPEQSVYYLLALARLIHMCFGLVLHVYIDFACQLKLGQKGQATQALNKSIKAKLKQARVLLDEMSHWQVLGTTPQLADVRVTEEQLQAMVLG
ncbi:hypothetical protein QJQ45_005394 [Haematococcus lacustris]|nr:hypothetical protein QJQ45_005394 [Haematococcus lacustris]